MSFDDQTSRHKAIDDTLRRAYGEVLGESLPDRFSQLLAELKASERTPHHRESKQA